MARTIGTVTVVGLGLIGSSIARAVMARLPDVTVTGHDASAGVRAE
ncbi:MAG: prephenate/arogenate dehydrogenase family protein, partial [Sphingopyxis granuli]